MRHKLPNPLFRRGRKYSTCRLCRCRVLIGGEARHVKTKKHRRNDEHRAAVMFRYFDREGK